MRGRFLRRIALLLLFLTAFWVGAATLLVWLVATALGLIEARAGAGLLTGLAVVAVPLALVGLALATGAVRRLAAPLDDLIEAAGRIEAGHYGARVVERGPREMRALARAFNAMSDRLAASEAQRRNLLADVTHELRTPLTVVQGGLEGLLDGVYPPDEAHLAPILEETRLLSRLIEDLRTLALAEAGALPLHREPTDLAALARETATSFRAQADAAGIDVSVSMAPGLPPLEVDPARTREVLSNLVANSLRYTPQGGSVRISGALEDGGKRVTVTVRDTGAGIPRDAVAHVFDRFYKSADSRGSGLGLAIARNLVVAHGGEIVAESEPGRGTEIRFVLPVTPST